MKRIAMTLVAGTMLALSGCATYDSGYSYGDRSPSYSNSQYNRVYGTVISVRDVELSSREYNGPGLGAVAGVIIGGVLGNQIGSGSGRALATGAGAVAGGFAGDRIERNTSGSKWGQEVWVRLDNGDEVSLVQPGRDVYNGARVYINGYGKNARAVLR